MLTFQDALKEINDEAYLTLFSRLKNRSLTGLTRQSCQSLRRLDLVSFFVKPHAPLQAVPFRQSLHVSGL